MFLNWLNSYFKKFSAAKGLVVVFYFILIANIIIFSIKTIWCGLKNYYLLQLLVSFFLVWFLKTFYINNTSSDSLYTKFIKYHTGIFNKINSIITINWYNFCFQSTKRYLTWVFTWFCFLHLFGVSVITILTWNCTTYVRITAGLAFIGWLVGLFALRLQKKGEQIYAIQLDKYKASQNESNEPKPVHFILREQHPYHILPTSSWPFLLCISVFDILFFTVKYFHYGLTQYTKHHLIIGVIGLSFVLFCWFKNIIDEANEGHHTENVRWNLLHGFVLFIASEVMLFFAIFWAFFHNSLSPSIWIDMCWPPMGIFTIDPFQLPFLNTLLLVSSGVTLTFSHRALAQENPNYYLTSLGLIWTLILGGLFTCIQGYEYTHAGFAINDGIYGSVFYFATGFHGLHVLIGSLMLLVSLIRNTLYQFHPEQHVGFLAAIWYWHFVDVVWIFLFITIYWWGSS